MNGNQSANNQYSCQHDFGEVQLSPSSFLMLSMLWIGTLNV